MIVIFFDSVKEIFHFVIDLRSQSRKSTSYGKGWSSYHGDCLFTFGDDFADVDDPGMFQ